MAKEQGDELPKDPPVYVRTVGDVEQERTAITPAEEVNLRAEGWVRKTGKRAGSRSGGAKGSAAQPAGADSERSSG